MKRASKKKFLKSLQMRILLIIFIFLFAPVAILFNYSYAKMESVLQDKTSGLILGNLEQIGSKIDNITEDIMKISSMVSSNSLIFNMLSGYGCKNLGDFATKDIMSLGAQDVIKISDVQKQIYYVKNNFFNYNMHVILFGADGNIYSSLDTVYDELDFKMNYIKEYKNQDWYGKLQSGTTTGVWTAPFSYGIGGAYDGQRYISLSRIIKDINTQDILGIIMVNFSEEDFDKYLGNSSNGTITLLNKDKTTIFSSVTGDPGSAPVPEDVYSGMPDQGKGYITKEIQNKRYLVNYYTMDKLGWTLVSVVPYSDVMKEISSLRAKTLTINIFIFVAFFILALVIILYMTNPLKKLIGNIRKMKIGDRSLDLPSIEYSDDVSGIVNTFEYMMKRVEELVETVINEQKYENDLKYEALRAQINPHFLFNTLNIIKWSALMSGSENVSKMISSLGKLLEISMNKGEDEITLREELELAESYVYIQNIRFNDKFKFSYMADEEIKDLKVLKLILQPIVENSIIHGFRNKTGDGEICIHAELRDGKLVISVKDNGAGISREKIPHILDGDYDPERRKFSRIGLINIHERLRIKYGNSYGLEIDSEEGKGTTVSAILPVFMSAAIGGTAVDQSADSR